MAKVITDDVKKAIEESPFIAITTLSKDNEPHLIVVGQAKEVKDDDSILFGVYKMTVTQQNLADTGVMQCVAVSGKVGFRLSGKACVKDGDVVFIAEQADTLL